MALVDQLLDQLSKRGLYIEAADEPGMLKLKGKTENVTPEIREAIRKFKQDLLPRFVKQRQDQPKQEEAGEPEPEPE